MRLTICILLVASILNVGAMVRWKREDSEAEPEPEGVHGGEVRPWEKFGQPKGFWAPSSGVDDDCSNVTNSQEMKISSSELFSCRDKSVSDVVCRCFKATPIMDKHINLCGSCEIGLAPLQPHLMRFKKLQVLSQMKANMLNDPYPFGDETKYRMMTPPLDAEEVRAIVSKAAEQLVMNIEKKGDVGMPRNVLMRIIEMVMLKNTECGNVGESSEESSSEESSSEESSSEELSFEFELLPGLPKRFRGGNRRGPRRGPKYDRRGSHGGPPPGLFSSPPKASFQMEGEGLEMVKIIAAKTADRFSCADEKVDPESPEFMAAFKAAFADIVIDQFN